MKILILLIITFQINLRADVFEYELLPRLPDIKGQYITIDGIRIGVGDVRYENSIPTLVGRKLYVIPDKQPKSKDTYVSEYYGEYVTIIYVCHDAQGYFSHSKRIHGFFALQKYQTWSRCIWIADNDSRTKYWKNYYNKLDIKTIY